MLMLDLAVGLNLAFENLYLPFFLPMMSARADTFIIVISATQLWL